MGNKKTNIKATLLLFPFLSLSFIPSLLTPLTSFPEWHQVGTLRFLSACPSSSYFSPAPAWALCGLWFFQEYPSAPAGILYRLQCGYLLWHGPLHGLKRNACSTMVSSKSCKGISSLTWRSFSSSSNIDVPSDVSHSSCSLLLCLGGIFCPFLGTFSQRCTTHHCWAQLSPVVGLFEEMTGTGHVQHGRLLP